MKSLIASAFTRISLTFGLQRHKSSIKESDSTHASGKFCCTTNFAIVFFKFSRVKFCKTNSGEII